MGQIMNETEDLEFETPLEEEVEEIEVSPDQRKIFTEFGDPEIEGLHGKAKRGRLILQPDFQRQFVWDKAKASRLIESALLGIPLPTIYLSQEADNKEYVIDGQQRLTSFFGFLDAAFPDGGEFKLSGLKVFRELNGITLKALGGMIILNPSSTMNVKAKPYIRDSGLNRNTFWCSPILFPHLEAFIDTCR